MALVVRQVKISFPKYILAQIINNMQIIYFVVFSTEFGIFISSNLKLFTNITKYTNVSNIKIQI